MPDDVAPVRDRTDELGGPDLDFGRRIDGLARRASAMQRYAELFEHAPDAYIVTDRDGVIEEANRAAGAMLGAGQRILRGNPLLLYVDDASKRELRTFLREAVESCRDDSRAAEHDLQFVMQRLGGHALHANASVAPMRDRDGRCLGLRWLIRDVTDRVRAEEKARRLNEVLEERVAERTAQLELRTRELEVADRAKSDFLAVMSHELRTPLQAVLGFADLMRADIPESMPEYARKWADHIHRAAEHLLALVEQILRFARLEAGQEVLRLESVDLADLAHQTVVLIEPAARLKRLRVTADVAPNLAAITTDAGKLRQILFNLLSNAVKFTERGDITLHVRREDHRAILEVRDTGVGIAPDHLDLVFDQFWQAECRPTAGKGGTGLGLSIARHLARLLGGDLTVQSTVGEGSIFCVDVPVDGTSQRAPAA